MDIEGQKRKAAQAAVEYIRTCDLIGVGTGSTVTYFIEALRPFAKRLQGAVASSTHTENLLRSIGVNVLDLNQTGTLPVYVDSADEATRHGHLIKGGGGALTREKIVAAASRRFVCIINSSKLVDILGSFGVPIEVIPMARSYVARKLSALGARVEWREGLTTDNGNVILDAYNMKIVDPIKLESELNQIAGVVSVGIFANRGADVLLVASDSGVDVISR